MAPCNSHNSRNPRELSDHQLFNCSEDYEVDYVSGLYSEKEKVKKFILDGCQSGRINETTHKELYAMLAKHGFHKKATVKC